MKDITRCKKDREGGCFIGGKIDEGKDIQHKDVHSIQKGGVFVMERDKGKDIQHKERERGWKIDIHTA